SSATHVALTEAGFMVAVFSSAGSRKIALVSVVVREEASSQNVSSLTTLHRMVEDCIPLPQLIAQSFPIRLVTARAAMPGCWLAASFQVILLRLISEAEGVAS